jgi:predicted MFS family arabinose efflux permease
LGAQWMGGHFGWEARFVFLFDFAALAGFFWTMVVTYRIWRRQKAASGNK